MAELALHPPVHLITHPEEPIRSLDAAAKVVRRHVHDKVDMEAEELLRELESANTTEQADAAGLSFRDWAEAEGLLLVPPEDA
jgi:hypothetical protein